MPVVDVSSVPVPPDAPLESMHVLMPEPPVASAQENVVDTFWLRPTIWLFAGELMVAVGGPITV